MSEIYAVQGGKPLSGTVNVSGAKNSVLKLMAVSLLTPGRTTLRNCPRILDVTFMGSLLQKMGATVSIDDQTVTIDVPEDMRPESCYPEAAKLRASICVLGPLLARFNAARVPLPGGDAIGTRPLDMHFAGLRALGVTVEIEHGHIVASAQKIIGTTITLPFPSVGATENILLASVFAQGTTIIDNAAREPEVADICEMLRKMGAKISGIGTSRLRIDGVAELVPTEHTVIGDRLVAATWAFGAVMTQGQVRVEGIDPQLLAVVIKKLTLAGAVVDFEPHAFTVSQQGRPRAQNIATLPYPGFPSDLQAMAVALACISQGLSIITENVFESRFQFVHEMIRLGADARTEGHHVVIRGTDQLSSAPVWSSDVRAGAGLVLAALCAQGQTEIHDVYHIERGYPCFVDQLRSLGANIVSASAEDFDW